MRRLEGYRFGRLTVDGEELTRNAIVLPKRVVTNWWRAEGHRLVMEDLQEVREELPEHLVVRTGAYGRMRPDPEAVEQLRREGVEVEALPIADAVRRYDELDPRRTAASPKNCTAAARTPITVAAGKWRGRRGRAPV